MKTKTILCFFDSDSGRDVQALAPIIYYLKTEYEIEFIYKFIFESYLIVSIKPDLVLLGNAVGSREYFHILKDCRKRQIPAFSLTAEGNIKEAFYESGLNWGWNQDKKIYQDILCLWSEESLEMYKKHWPQIDFSRTVVTGGSGFDIYQMAAKQKELKPIVDSSKYKKVVGYAGWAFGKTHSPIGSRLLKDQFKEKFSEEKEWRLRKQKEMTTILRNAIESNPDFLFILKKHPKENPPNETIDFANEMNELTTYENVIYITDEKFMLYEIIGTCDVWTCFESTTILEAWLMDIPTVNISPDDDNKYQSSIASGSIKVANTKSFNKILDKLRASELKNCFNEVSLANNRERIIKDSIGYADGFNHIRIAQKLLESFTKERLPKYSYSKMNILHKLMMNIMPLLVKSKYLSKLEIVHKHRFLIDDFDIKSLENNLQKFFVLIKGFYSSNREKVNDFKMGKSA